METWIVCKPGLFSKATTAKAVKAEYAAGKDFINLSPWGPGYVSRREVERHGLTLEVRYGKNLEKVTVLK